MAMPTNENTFKQRTISMIYLVIRPVGLLPSVIELPLCGDNFLILNKRPHRQQKKMKYLGENGLLGASGGGEEGGS